MASAVDRTIGASMGDLSRRIKRILQEVTTELRGEMQELEIQKRMAETGRDYHMKESHTRKLENIKMKAKLDKCERMRRQLDNAKALARKVVGDNKQLNDEVKSLEESLMRAEEALETALERADDKIDALEEQLGVATRALDRVNKTKLRF